MPPVVRKKKGRKEEGDESWGPNISDIKREELRGLFWSI
jgi:hypothetical protein